VNNKEQGLKICGPLVRNVQSARASKGQTSSESNAVSAGARCVDICKQHMKLGVPAAEKRPTMAGCGK